MESDATVNQMPPLVMGGAGFSYQLHPHPESLPVSEILLRAFDLGLRTIDTSPYYEPSEKLIGAALSHPDITAKYARQDIVIMTKVGRITEEQFDYSAAGIRDSVARSLQRLQTTYLDLVFCHDVEFVSLEEAVSAVGVLFELQDAGKIRRVGISGHDMRILAIVASLARDRYGRPLDSIQTWAHLTLQNTQAEQWGFDLFRAAGVSTVFCSSPLAVGLLRNGGIPRGLTGDWHPAPRGLRTASQTAAEWIEKQGDTLASVALRFAVAKVMQNSSEDFAVSTITGISSISDLEQNVATAKRILKAPCGQPAASATLEQYTILDMEALERDRFQFEQTREILGQWVDYDFSGEATKKENAVPDTVEEQSMKPGIRASM